ncbi:vegetative incompatibility het-e-1 [Trichoderma arundinaceum]|uniref:Vegetative incompatibility het-e-1 n=1 Tax=Trichoderma arundinaceum TaxID=490622 RepID=A0A395NZA9_TRIAR|nr:vegetative incompatibility het-e-1 [Trichoderma arundinaceum]
MDARQNSVFSNQMTLTNDGIHYVGYSEDSTSSTVVDTEVARLRNALQPLIQPGKGPLSLKQLAEDISKPAELEAEATTTIHTDLVKLLWKDDWKLDISMAGGYSGKIDATMVAHAIAAGIQFKNIQTREEAISKNFEATFSWIFRKEPPKKDDVPMWSSFPKWLEDDSENVYWITGKPGSGKSTMMKLILQQKSFWEGLPQSTGSLRLLLVKYYAWLSGDTLQKSLEGLKRTIIFQALKQYPELLPVLTPRRWAFCQVLRSISGLPMWEAWEVEESFEALLSSCGETIKLILFIDGLDEFDMPPIQLIEYIRYMKARCHTGLKVCAASRPWTEFQDEFNEGPRLQMHLLTQDDIRTFITEKFKTNRGFLEQQQLSSEAATQLLADIAHRANGVFLWVSIVVQHLLALFSEGQLISQAWQTLEALPTKISSLYDTIWASIREENTPDASFMMQVLRAFDRPMPWLTAWVIEESRFNPTEIISIPQDRSSWDVALRSLKRKLTALTKCILEVSGSENSTAVDFIHRTARDWATQPKKWQSICSSFSGEFDPQLCILKGETLILSLECGPESPFPKGEVLDAVPRILWHASEVKDIPQNTEDLLVSVRKLGVLWTDAYLAQARNELRFNGGSKPRLWRKRPTFPGLVAQFSILPYFRFLALSPSSFSS